MTKELTVTDTQELADGSRVRADYLVGCDGGRSTVRGPPASSSPAPRPR
ncbi:FAD-dependent monooxygenase [Nonomuraea dietziae]